MTKPREDEEYRRLEKAWQDALRAEESTLDTLLGLSEFDEESRASYEEHLEAQEATKAAYAALNARRDEL